MPYSSDISSKDFYLSICHKQKDCRNATIIEFATMASSVQSMDQWCFFITVSRESKQFKSQYDVSMCNLPLTKVFNKCRDFVMQIYMHACTHTGKKKRKKNRLPFPWHCGSVISGFILLSLRTVLLFDFIWPLRELSASANSTVHEAHWKMRMTSGYA